MLAKQMGFIYTPRYLFVVIHAERYLGLEAVTSELHIISLASK